MTSTLTRRLAQVALAATALLSTPRAVTGQIVQTFEAETCDISRVDGRKVRRRAAST